MYFPVVAHVAAVAALSIVASGTLFVAPRSGPRVDGQLTNNSKSYAAARPDGGLGRAPFNACGPFSGLPCSVHGRTCNADTYARPYTIPSLTSSGFLC
jgi:hypothetical protein